MPHAASQPDHNRRPVRVGRDELIEVSSMYQRWGDHDFDSEDLLYSIDHAIKVRGQKEQAVKVNVDVSAKDYPDSLNPIAAAQMDHSHLEKLRGQLESGDDIIAALEMVQNPIQEPQMRQKPTD